VSIAVYPVLLLATIWLLTVSREYPGDTVCAYRIFCSHSYVFRMMRGQRRAYQTERP
jgi:hypothetical protein